jgi:hypothetical protein
MSDLVPVFEYEIEVTEIDPVPSSRGDYCFEATVSRLERLHAGTRQTVDPPKHLFWGKDAAEVRKKAHTVIQGWIAEQGGIVGSAG